MDLTNSIKRAPRWAWYTAAGVGVGAAGLKLWKNRAVGATDQSATDGTSTGDLTGTGAAVLTGSPTSVIVPPIVTGGGDSGGSSSSLIDMMSLWTGATQTTIDQLSSIYAPVAAIEADLLGQLPVLITQNQVTPAQLLAMMQAGQSPAAPSQTPAVINTPTPAAATPAQSTPPPAAPPPAATSSGPQCGGEYPFASDQGCYKVVCANGRGDYAKGRWHFYQSDRKVHVRDTC